MNNNKYFIGIDVSKDTLDIAINKEAEPQHHLTVSNDLKGMKAFVKKAKEWKIDLKNALFCLEYTGLYNYTLLDFLSGRSGPTEVSRRSLPGALSSLRTVRDSCPSHGSGHLACYPLT